MKINIDYIIAERERRERERLEREAEEGRRLPLYIERRPDGNAHEPHSEKYRFD
jgi:hypothetical protein